MDVGGVDGRLVNVRGTGREAGVEHELRGVEQRGRRFSVLAPSCAASARCTPAVFSTTIRRSAASVSWAKTMLRGYTPSATVMSHDRLCS